MTTELVGEQRQVALLGLINLFKNFIIISLQQKASRRDLVLKQIEMTV